MAIRDEDIGASVTLIEGDDGVWSSPMAASASEPRDWQSLYEQAQAHAETERARADAGEARVQELLNDVRRLRTSLRKAEVGKGASGPAPRNTRRAHKALASKAPKATTGQLSRENARLRKALERSQEQKDELVALRRKVAALRRSKRPTQASRPRSERPAAQGAGTRAQAEGHDQGAARGSRVPEPRDPWAEAGEPQAAPRSGTVARPQGDRTPTVPRGQAAPRGAGGIPRPDGPHPFADEAHRLSATRPEEVHLREAGAGGRACRTSPAQRGLQETARSGQDHRVAAQGDRAAGQGDHAAGARRTNGWARR